MKCLLKYYLHKSILIKSLKVSDLMYLSTLVNSYLCVMQVTRDMNITLRCMPMSNISCIVDLFSGA